MSAAIFVDFFDESCLLYSTGALGHMAFDFVGLV